MRRNFKGSTIYESPYDHEEDADPRVGLVNLADVMLVFACGLMLALVSHWNLNLDSLSQVDETRLDETDGVEEMISDIESGNSGYDERGTVYQDPETGQLYLISTVDETSGADAAAGE